MSIWTKEGMKGTEKSRNMSTKAMAESMAVTVMAPDPAGGAGCGGGWRKRWDQT